MKTHKPLFSNKWDSLNLLNIQQAAGISGGSTESAIDSSKPNPPVITSSTETPPTIPSSSGRPPFD